jgi:hypothetical protein
MKKRDINQREGEKGREKNTRAPYKKERERQRERGREEEGGQGGNAREREKRG